MYGCVWKCTPLTNALRARHEKTKRNRLGMSVSKLPVASAGKRQRAPICREAGERRESALHLLDLLVMQEVLPLSSLSLVFPPKAEAADFTWSVDILRTRKTSAGATPVSDTIPTKGYLAVCGNPGHLGVRQTKRPFRCATCNGLAAVGGWAGGRPHISSGIRSGFLAGRHRHR